MSEVLASGKGWKLVKTNDLAREKLERLFMKSHLEDVAERIRKVFKDARNIKISVSEEGSITLHAEFMWLDIGNDLSSCTLTTYLPRDAADALAVALRDLPSYLQPVSIEMDEPSVKLSGNCYALLRMFTALAMLRDKVLKELERVQTKAFKDVYDFHAKAHWRLYKLHDIGFELEEAFEEAWEEVE